MQDKISRWNDAIELKPIRIKTLLDKFAWNLGGDVKETNKIVKKLLRNIGNDDFLLYRNKDHNIEIIKIEKVDTIPDFHSIDIDDAFKILEIDFHLGKAIIGAVGYLLENEFVKYQACNERLIEYEAQSFQYRKDEEEDKKEIEAEESDFSDCIFIHESVKSFAIKNKSLDPKEAIKMFSHSDIIDNKFSRSARALFTFLFNNLDFVYRLNNCDDLRWAFDRIESFPGIRTMGEINEEALIFEAGYGLYINTWFNDDYFKEVINNDYTQILEAGSEGIVYDYSLEDKNGIKQEKRDLREKGVIYEKLLGEYLTNTAKINSPWNKLTKQQLMDLLNQDLLSLNMSKDILNDLKS